MRSLKGTKNFPERSLVRGVGEVSKVADVSSVLERTRPRLVSVKYGVVKSDGNHNCSPITSLPFECLFDLVPHPVTSNRCSGEHKDKALMLRNSAIDCRS